MFDKRTNAKTVATRTVKNGGDNSARLIASRNRLSSTGSETGTDMLEYAVCPDSKRDCASADGQAELSGANSKYWNNAVHYTHMHAMKSVTEMDVLEKRSAVGMRRSTDRKAGTPRRTKNTPQKY